MTDAYLAVLLEIRDELRALRAHCASGGRGRLSREDRELLASLLPAIAGAFGSREFMAKELLATRSLRLLTEGMSARSLGKLLARAENMTIDGRMIERYATELGVVLWRVVGTDR